MNIRIDPNDPPAGGDTPNPADAAANAGADAGKDGGAAPFVETPAADPDAAALAAFEKGIESTKGEAPAADEPAAGKDGAKPGDEGKTPEEITAEAEAAKGKDGKPAGEAAKPAEGEGEKPKPDEKVEAEIKELGLKERAAERFRELTSRVAEMEPLRARAARADEWEQTVLSTGASPEQFGSALSYLRDINSGDPARMLSGYNAALAEVQALGQALGLPTPGGPDPLETHADLKKLVDEQDITREAALEIARSRQTEKLRKAADDTRANAGQQEAAVNAALQRVTALGSQLRAADPTGFDAKFKIASPMIARIQKTLPPDQWVDAIKEHWDALPVLPVAQAKPAVSTQPLRPTGASAGQVRKPKNDVEAFELGVATAKASGQ